MSVRTGNISQRDFHFLMNVMLSVENIGRFLLHTVGLQQSQLTRNQILKPVMLNYESECCEAGDTRQSPVAVLGVATRAGSTDMSAETVASLKLVSPGAITYGVTLFFLKKLTTFLVSSSGQVMAFFSPPHPLLCLPTSVNSVTKKINFIRVSRPPPRTDGVTVAVRPPLVPSDATATAPSS